MFLGSDLLDPNAYVSIYEQRASQDASGGTTMAAGTLIEASVPVLVSLATGPRDGRFHSDLSIDGGTYSGESANLGRQDVVLVFLSGSLAAIPVGLTARIVDVTDHPASPDGWIPARYTGRWEVVQFGAGS